eukprot:CAMPEP_0168579830 /NCGR_PEP_ID=MMETSP0420-20121227/446_1 /TAXON_ID=498008 /ORGANISM="Pessonella sp." /LENGTH=235 /DNA_ID=CAMNT_0008613853 /DNA_START=440 /DNA_END=1144 /DNA_ORIENTATION=+
MLDTHNLKCNLKSSSKKTAKLNASDKRKKEDKDASPTKSPATSPRSVASDEDVAILRPVTNVDELESELEETILRVHILQRQKASAQHALLDTDIPPEEREEIKGLVKELTSELKRQEARMARVEAQLGKQTGEPLRSPTLRVVDKRGVLEFDEGVELDDESLSASDPETPRATLEKGRSSLATRMKMQKAQSASYDRRGVTALPPQPKMPGRGNQRPTTPAPSPSRAEDSGSPL